jgi:hypothetical protein
MDTPTASLTEAEIAARIARTNLTSADGRPYWRDGRKYQHNLAAVRALDPFRSTLSDYARLARSEYAEKRRAPAPATERSSAGAQTRPASARAPLGPLAREARSKPWALPFARRARTPA